MTYTTTNIQEFLAGVTPFNQLQPAVLAKFLEKAQLYRYRMGQVILAREKIPAQVSILFSGQVRLLGYESQSQIPVTLGRLQPGEIMGWLETIRRVPASTAIASTEVICVNIDATDFLALLEQEESFGTHFYNRAGIVEVFELLHKQLGQQANSQLILKTFDSKNCKELALKIFDDVQVVNSTTRDAANQLSPDYVWLLSGGEVSPDLIGSRFDSTQPLPKASWLRLLGIRNDVFSTSQESLQDITEEVQQANITEVLPASSSDTYDDIPYAPAEPPEAENNLKTRDFAPSNYPHVRGSGQLGAILACFQMLSKHLNMPFRKEVIRKVLVNQQKRTGSLSLQQCGAIAQLVGLRPQLIGVPPNALGRIEAPAIVQWQDSFAVLYEISAKTMVVGVPESGILRQKTSDVAQVLLQSKPETQQEEQQDAVPVLLLQATSETPQQKFGLSWFLPSINKYKGVLVEVFIASFFFQLFGLANPLVTQVIIDKVINQNSPDTLQVLGVFLVVIAIFEAILGSLRT